MSLFALAALPVFAPSPYDWVAILFVLLAAIGWFGFCAAGYRRDWKRRGNTGLEPGVAERRAEP
jgi:hypothetical protein